MVMESVAGMHPKNGWDSFMTHGGYGGGQPDPFGPDPYRGPPSTEGYSPPPVTQGFSPGQGFPPSSGTPHGEVNTLATLSIVFAFVFAPAGAALGHLALSQIKQRGERGRERAIVGLTLSYVIIVLAVIALLIWLVTANPAKSPSVPTPTTATQITTSAAPVPPPRTTVITPPPAQRPTVSVEALRVGDCVEVQQTQPDPTRGRDTNIILIFPVRCEVRDGVFRVDQILSTSSCPGQALFNRQETIFACISNYRG
jgi:peptidyl-prolyl cis-trans isomerase B (cyclophilin B)